MKMHRRTGAAGMVVGALAALVATGQPAGATDGYFQVGFGPRQSALGGAGVADSRDAMAQTLNPAGIVGVGDQWQLGVTAFMPFRGYSAVGTGFILPGTVDSDSNFFAIPNFAYVHQIDDVSAWGISLYGNGGMNTNYPALPNAAPACGGFGVYCFGPAGVDLMQAFMSFTYAREMGPLKIGIAPTIAVQRFEAFGLGAFGGISSNPANLTNRGYDYSFGGGLRAGVEWEAMPGLRFGLAGQTPMFMTKFDKYSGLFADQGSFNIPAAITAGVAYDATPDLTLMFDYQHIFYSGVDAIANSSTTPLPLGFPGGPGFGWSDVNVFKIGAEWRASDKWTWRAGYAYSDNPVGSGDVTFNILAPGIVQHHITAGGSYKVNDRDTIDFSAMFVPKSTVSGIEITPPPGGPNLASNITLNMHQFQFGLGWTRKY